MGSEVKLRAVLVGGNLGLSVVVPLLAALTNRSVFTDAELFILGALLFIALSCFELLVLAERAYAKDVRNNRIWDAREALDARLQEVRRLFHEVDENRVADTDLFVSYFNKKLLDLENGLRDACSKSEVRIDETMLEVTTWLLESSFHGRPADVFRAIHFTSDNDFFFDIHAKRYFRQVYNLVRQGKIVGVKRIAVYAAEQELKDPRTLRLISFHQSNPGYEMKLLSQDAFMQVVRDYHLQNLVKDFGIYGQTYLYKGIIAKDEDIVGSYSRDAVEITRYVDCFETCWQIAKLPPASQVHSVDMDTLYETEDQTQSGGPDHDGWSSLIGNGVRLARQLKSRGPGRS